MGITRDDAAALRQSRHFTAKEGLKSAKILAFV
jgi:hypothetical protein